MRRVFNRSFGHLPAVGALFLRRERHPGSDHRGASGKHTPRSSPTKKLDEQRPATRTPDHLLRRITPAPAATAHRPAADPHSARVAPRSSREQLARETRRRQDKRRAIPRPASSPPRRLRKMRCNTAAASKKSVSDAPEGRFVCEIVDRGDGSSTTPQPAISRPREGNRCRALGRPTADLADRVLPLAGRIHHTHLALGEPVIIHCRSEQAAQLPAAARTPRLAGNQQHGAA